MSGLLVLFFVLVYKKDLFDLLVVEDFDVKYFFNLSSFHSLSTSMVVFV